MRRVPCPENENRSKRHQTAELQGGGALLGPAVARDGGRAGRYLSESGPPVRVPHGNVDGPSFPREVLARRQCQNGAGSNRAPRWRGPALAGQIQGPERAGQESAAKVSGNNLNGANNEFYPSGDDDCAGRLAGAAHAGGGVGPVEIGFGWPVHGRPGEMLEVSVG